MGNNFLIRRDLYKKPYGLIPFPLNKQKIEQAIASFFEFLELPDPIKAHMDLKISPLHRRGDLGFKRRDPEGDVYNDHKSFFHYHPIIEKQYAHFIAQHKKVKIFLENAAGLWKLVYHTIYEILSEFEQEYPGTLSRVFETQTPHILLRFLKYDYPKSGHYLAKPHFDAGSFTLAIAESTPGLRIGTNPEDLELVEHKENQAVFMVASNFKKIIDTDNLKPAWHDVIQINPSDVGQPFSRWALVAFIDGYDVAALSRKETHKFSELSYA